MSIKQIKKSMTLGLATIASVHATALTSFASSSTGDGAGGLKFTGTDDGANVNSGLRGTNTNFSDAVQNIIQYLTYFLYVVAVVFALWGGFQILTAAGEEEKVKKGKTILIQAAIGLFVIFIASSLVRFIISAISAASTGSANDSVVTPATSILFM